jgi:hypothetical protein
MVANGVVGISYICASPSEKGSCTRAACTPKSTKAKNQVPIPTSLTVNMEGLRARVKKSLHLHGTSVDAYYAMHPERIRQAKRVARALLPRNPIPLSDNQGVEQYGHNSASQQPETSSCPPDPTYPVQFVLETRHLNAVVGGFSHAYVRVGTSSIHLYVDFRKSRVYAGREEDEEVKPYATVVEIGETKFTAVECECIGTSPTCPFKSRS